MSDAVAVDPNDPGKRTELPVGYRSQDHPVLDTIQNVLAWTGAFVGGVTLIAMVVLTSVEVIMRYFFTRPLGWNVAFTEQYLMVGLAFIGLTVAYRTGAHVAVLSFYERFSGRTRKVIMLFTHVLIMFGMALIVWNGAVAAWHAFSFNEVPPPGGSELPLPSGLWRSLVPIGAGMFFINIAVDFYRELTAPWNEPVTEVGLEAHPASSDQTEGL